MADTELQAVRDAAARFARSEVRSLFDGEVRDGDRRRLRAVLETAWDLGLVASADPQGAGDYGIWGRGWDGDPRPSLAMLEAVAEVCAGVAASLHFAGLSASVLPAASPAPRWAGLALPPLGDGTGTAPGAFAYGPASTEVWVVVRKQGAAIVDAGGSGPEHDGSMGLWACTLCPAPEPRSDAPRVPADADRLRTDLFLGQTALATGNLKGALAHARVYVSERHQGGRRIVEHPAVARLLGTAEAAVGRAAALLAWALETKAPHEAFRRAAVARLEGVGGAAAAVSDALQVFGGYGYMEDYGLEKRLRDALVLDALGGRPDDVRLWLGRPSDGDVSIRKAPAAGREASA